MGALSPFLRDIIDMRIAGAPMRCFPYETATIIDTTRKNKQVLEVNQVTNVVWCAMLCGRGKKSRRI